MILNFEIKQLKVEVAADQSEMNLFGNRVTIEKDNYLESVNFWLGSGALKAYYNTELDELDSFLNEMHSNLQELLSGGATKHEITEDIKAYFDYLQPVF
ncbi:hypothetical protein [Enterococcus sp. DIV0800]|uniref:hypothetical protein n=1 Tax=unclassified Enterococcus TaxID=2608891 RepID=UPI003D2FFE57